MKQQQTTVPVCTAPVVLDVGSTRVVSGWLSPAGAPPYEPPAATRVGTLVSLAAGSYSEGQQDDGDYHTTKWHA
ncbi:hypothetical protein Z951_00030 [Streptomyces sp. PRh5]|uniref:hypothetical protein n=1 Tax=Streptomyces sp. PRh5 TaxID=1158056 RepID=UPI000448B1D4|nr:hypothetical protein [Streptomyces sp. PRh5]EXU70166.1 hypothetical protein Z951_00030 [Streptomyces sp. PRh5]